MWIRPISLCLSLFLDENTRVCLSPVRGVDGSDYINASYIDVRSMLVE